MYDDSYLVPANAKKGTLWLNFLRPIDAIILASGVVVMFVLLLMVSRSNGSTISYILAIIPGAICALLVLPIPNYHNTLCAIQSIISFYTERRRFVWKGWCFYERFLSETKK